MSCRVFIFVLCLALGSMLAAPAMAQGLPVVVVDDFEAYHDDDPPIWMVWIDGFGTVDNGSIVGYWWPPFAELVIVHGGDTSMPFFYDNNEKYSGATKTLTSGNDWTVEGVTKLSLWFRGDPENAAEPMYVALDGNAGVYHQDPDATQIDTWTEWVIDLQEFADQGVNLAYVNSITIGFGDPDHPQPGGSGLMYFDDIRLLSTVVGVDIKPGSDPNPINPDSKGLVPVAIFSSPEFDATQVDPTSISLAGAGVAVRGKGKLMAHVEDVDGDGLLDLLVQVETQGFDDLGDGGTVELTGTTFSGETIVGYDEVIIVPPGKK